MTNRAKCTCTGVNKVKSYTPGQEFYYEYSLYDICERGVEKQLADKIPQPPPLKIVAMTDLGLEPGVDYFIDVTKV